MDLRDMKLETGGAMKIRNLSCARIACAVTTSLRRFFKQAPPKVLVAPRRGIFGQAVGVCLAALIIPGATHLRAIQPPDPTSPNLQSPYNPPYAAITYPAADPTTQSTTVFTPCTGNIFALVGVQPGQAVNVVIQYPTSQALQFVNLVAPDGGMVLPPDVPKLSVEAGVRQGWAEWVDASVSLDRFGASAPGEIVLDKFGFNVDNVVARATALLERVA